MAETDTPKCSGRTREVMDLLHDEIEVGEVVVRGYLGWSNHRSGLEFYDDGGRWVDRKGPYIYGPNQPKGDLLTDLLERLGVKEGTEVVVVCTTNRHRSPAQEEREAERCEFAGEASGTTDIGQPLYRCKVAQPHYGDVRCAGSRVDCIHQWRARADAEAARAERAEGRVAELEADWHDVSEENFRALWQAYALAPDETLTAEALKLKRRLRAIVSAPAPAQEEE